MPDYLLRIEGVNLDAVLNDTQDLNTIRGGSLLLRQAIADIEEKYFSEQNYISSGASVGLFRFSVTSEENAKQKQKEVVQFLNQDPNYCHLTFVVDIQASDMQDVGDFIQNKEKVLARNRFRQMQQASIALPEKNRDPHKQQGVCQLDNLRPSIKSDTVAQATRFVSSSVYQRRQYGRDQKKAEFYQQETHTQETGIKNLRYTPDLTTLATCKGHPLDHKIAVFYCDGNSFSNIQQQHAKTPEQLKNFDQTIRKYRKDFLTAYLAWLQSQPDAKTQSGALRLEILLWGGDEFTLIVPAWLGLETLGFFYNFSAKWTFQEQRLTHAGGLVLAHAKTPIKRVEQLAKNLAQRVKDYPGGKSENYFDYTVLESIDFPTQSLERFQQKLFGTSLACSRPILPPLDMERYHQAQQLKQLLGKGQVYALVRAILDSDKAFELQLMQLAKIVDMDFKGQQFEEAEDLYRTRLRQLNNLLQQVFPQPSSEQQRDNCWQWLHLAELWDYFPESNTYDNIKSL
ncbi:hypothetical protein [Candidatus Venteria ishoeyi]|uniref:Uncharacterized protein n=1 Tax=Candidatus Venteria ishoeyi TaxID=1899563 RepID=A0A1H6FFN4_9GAMM|nr:hypothetical protein [Candidatus Venteria ishoeyi]SEH08159.1 Uncharacterised protein [Candidatus Venteria ishoeyi]